MWARKVDNSHSAIIQALRLAGCTVFDASRLPNFVDLVVLAKGRIHLVECKSKGGKLTASQTALQAAGWPIVVLHDERAALEWMSRQRF